METVTLRGITEKIRSKIGRGKRAILSPEEGTKLLDYLERNAAEWSELRRLLEPFEADLCTDGVDDVVPSVKALLSLVEDVVNDKCAVQTRLTTCLNKLRLMEAKEAAVTRLVAEFANIWTKATKGEMPEDPWYSSRQ